MKFLLVLFALVAAASAQTNPCDGEVFQFLPHPDRCESFIMCMLERPVTLTCNPNFIWDQTRSRCRLGSPVSCEFRFGPEPSCDETVFSIHYREDTCTEFFICMIGQRVNFRCGPGEIFDIYRRACIPGDDYLCIADDPTPYKKD